MIIILKNQCPVDYQVHMSCEIQVKVTKYKCVNNICKGKQFT